MYHLKKNYAVCERYNELILDEFSALVIVANEAIFIQETRNKFTRRCYTNNRLLLLNEANEYRLKSMLVYLLTQRIANILFQNALVEKKEFHDNFLEKLSRNVSDAKHILEKRIKTAVASDPERRNAILAAINDTNFDNVFVWKNDSRLDYKKVEFRKEKSKISGDSEKKTVKTNDSAAKNNLPIVPNPKCNIEKENIGIVEGEVELLKGKSKIGGDAEKKAVKTNDSAEKNNLPIVPDPKCNIEKENIDIVEGDTDKKNSQNENNFKCYNKLKLEKHKKLITEDEIHVENRLIGKSSDGVAMNDSVEKRKVQTKTKEKVLKASTKNLPKIGGCEEEIPYKLCEFYLILHY